MKTIHEWLKAELRSEHYELIKKYENMFAMWEDNASSAWKALDMAITWYKTQEGHDFWSEICKQLREGKYRKTSNIFLKL